MDKKGSNLKEQVKAGFDAIDVVVSDLQKAFDDELTAVQNQLTNDKISVKKNYEKVKALQAEALHLEGQIESLTEWKKDLKKREQRAEKTEELLEEEKKVLTAKKQHLIEWEKELNEKARRLNG